MSEFFLRPAAVGDLNSIWEYTVGTWDEEQAERYLRMLHRSFDDLAHQRIPGRACDAIRAGYRKHLVGRHVVYYRTTAEGDIDVVRILHQSMDIERHL